MSIIASLSQAESIEDIYIYVYVHIYIYIYRRLVTTKRELHLIILFVIFFWSLIFDYIAQSTIKHFIITTDKTRRINKERWELNVQRNFDILVNMVNQESLVVLGY